MKKLSPFLAILAIVAFVFAPIGATVKAAPAIYSATVSVTSTASTVTPTAANGKPTSVVIQNDGSGDIFVDFDRVSVAAAATTIRVKACAQVTVNFNDTSFTTMSVITASGTATARVTAHYMKGTYPQSPAVAERLVFAQNPNCSTLSTLPLYGADVASATALPVPTGQVVTVTGTTTITSITSTGLVAGSRITLIFAGVLTLTDGSNLVLAGNFVTTADDTVTLVFNGTSFFETSRSVN